MRFFFFESTAKKNNTEKDDEHHELSVFVKEQLKELAKKNLSIPIQLYHK